MEEDLKRILDEIENNGVKGLSYALSKANEDIVSVIKKPTKGEEITEKEAEQLFLIENDMDLSALVLMADKIRKDDVGDDITYVVNRNINFTNICNTYCGFCNFMDISIDQSRSNNLSSIIKIFPDFP